MIASMKPKVESEPQTEADKVKGWRIHEALEITHCTLDAAIDFAESDGDLHKLASLVEDGCPGELALRIA